MGTLAPTLATVCEQHRVTPWCAVLLLDWRDTRDGQRFMDGMPLRPQFPVTSNRRRNRAQYAPRKKKRKVRYDDDPWGLEDR